MQDLIDSIAIETKRKRLPKSKHGRLLVALSNHYREKIKENAIKNKCHVPTAMTRQLENIEAQIDGLLEQENLRANKQLNMFDVKEDTMFTTERTVIEFENHGRILKATYTGTITDAKNAIRKERGVFKFRWAHYHRVADTLVRGMWVEMNAY
jgi:hypothetical protein